MWQASLLLLLFHPSAFLSISLSVSQSTHQLFSLGIAAASHLSEVIYSRLSPLHGFSTPSPTCTQKNMSTTNPANMQSPLAKQRSPHFRLVSPRVPLSFILLSVYLPCTCTMQLRAHARTFKEMTDLTAWRQLLWHFGKQPWLPQPVDGLRNHIFPLRECVSKDAN